MRLTFDCLLIFIELQLISRDTKNIKPNLYFNFEMILFK